MGFCGAFIDVNAPNRAGGYQVHAARHHHRARGQLRSRPGRRAHTGGGAGPAAALLAGPHHALLQVGAEAAVQRAVLLDVVRGVA